MAIERSDSQQTTCNATAIIDGEKRQVASAICAVRPGRGLTLSIDLSQGFETLAEDDAKAIAAMFQTYMNDELEKARGLGIPI